MWRRKLVACGVLLTTVVFSFLPIQDKRALHTKGRWHPFGHFFLFMALAALVLTGVERRRSKAALLLGLFVLAVGIELMQHVLYATPLEVNDMTMDGLGIVCGGLLQAVWPRASAL